MKAVFLEQDGALLAGVPDDPGPRRTALGKEAGAALRLLARLGYRLFVVSHQAGIAFGRVTEAAMADVEASLRHRLGRERLALDGYYFCPHHPDGSVGAYACDCHCRRPMPGLLLRAARDHRIDLRASWVLGAILHDVEAGNRAGCRTVLIDNGNETEWRLGPRRMPTRMAPDLHAAAVLIASHGVPA